MAEICPHSFQFRKALVYVLKLYWSQWDFGTSLKVRVCWELSWIGICAYCTWFNQPMRFGFWVCQHMNRKGMFCASRSISSSSISRVWKCLESGTELFILKRHHCILYICTDTCLHSEKFCSTLKKYSPLFGSMLWLTISVAQCPE